MNKRVIIGIIILVLIVGVIIVGYFKNKPKERMPGIIEVNQPQQPSPLPLPQPTPSPESTQISSTPTSTTLTTGTPTKPYQLLFNQPFLYLDLDYPLLYVYDPQQEIIKYFNLEDETYKEIAKVPELKQGWLSEDKTKIITETNDGFSIIDLKTDNLYRLSPLTKKVVPGSNIFLYLSDDRKISYLATFRDGKITKIRDLGVLNPDFIVLKNGLLIYEPDGPVFFLDLKKPDTLKIFLEPKNEYSLLTNKNKDLIFVNFKENNIWQSEIIDLNKKLRYSFSWATIKDKCSFDNVLICALPSNLKNFSLEDWLMLKPNYDEKIVIYDPQNNNINEILLDDKFDFVRPKLTPLGIITWNRLDGRFYLLKVE